jgi:primosomal protein N'
MEAAAPQPTREAADPPRFARVAVALPVDRALHYRIPDRLLGRVHLGSRVRATLSGRPVDGTVVGIDAVAEVARVVELAGVVEPSARVGRDLIELSRWVADRYGASLGETLESVLPPPLRHGRGLRRIVVVRLAAAPPSELAAEIASLDARFPKQARALRILAEAGGEMRELDLLRRAQIGPSPVQSLARRGRVARTLVEDPGDPGLATAVAKAPPPRPTPEQQHAVRAVELALAARTSRGFLLARRRSTCAGSSTRSPAAGAASSSCRRSRSRRRRSRASAAASRASPSCTRRWPRASGCASGAASRRARSTSSSARARRSSRRCPTSA